MSQHPTYDAISGDHEQFEEYEDEWHISDRAKRWATICGVLLGSIILYVFCFVLPSMFIPSAQALEPIVKVKDLKIQLKPVSTAESQVWEQLGEVAETEGDGAELKSDWEIDASEMVKSGDSPASKERLILIGDIHGQYKEFTRLMRKIGFRPKKDQLVVLGDFVAKGPQSMDVVDALIELNASCVLGNHEAYALANYAQFHNLQPAVYNEMDKSVSAENQKSHQSAENQKSHQSAENVKGGLSHSRKSGSTNPMVTGSQTLVSAAGFNLDPEYLLAKKLEPRHIKYINSCSVMLRLGNVPLGGKHKKHPERAFAQGVAVHAGLRWDLATLQDQSPRDCLEMRSYLAPYYNVTTDDPHEKGAVSWSKIYNRKQKERENEKKTEKEERIDSHVVYYGHDARRGLNLKKWTKGLDTGCVRGDALTAMVIWKEETDGKSVYKEEPVSVQC